MLRLERWTEPLAESNCYLLGEAGRAVVIDPNDPRGPLERLEALGWTPERILLTHEHCDHMAGLEALRNRWPGVRVAATPGSAGIFLDGDTFFSGDYLIPGEEVILRLPGGSETDYRAVTEPILRGLPPGLRICPGHGEPYILTGKE